MKKIYLSIIVLLFVSAEKSFAQADPAYDSLVALNLDYYAGKPVDSLLQVIPKSYNAMRIWGVLTKNKARGLNIRYPTGMMITIIPKKFLYMNPMDPNRVWDLSLFKKETAFYISVMHPEFNGLSGKVP